MGQNKTHQLVLKDLYDHGVFNLPVLEIRPELFHSTIARFAPGIEFKSDESALHLVNQANGGEIELSLSLAEVIRGFETGISVDFAFRSQYLWDQEKFARFVTFLYRNDYLVLDSCSVLMHTANSNAVMPLVGC